MKRMLKGISPLVVALLLILIGIAASIILYMWLTGFTSSATNLPAEMQINIRLEAADLKGGSNTQVIYGRNVGTTTIDLKSLKDIGVYIYFHYNGTLAYAKVISNPYSNGNITDATGDGLVDPGEAFKITLKDPTLSTVIASGQYYDIKVVISGVEAWLTGVKAK